MTDPLPAKNRHLNRSLAVGFAGSPAREVSPGVKLAVPWLGGAAVEEIFRDLEPLGATDGVQLHRGGELLVGHVREPLVAGELAARTEKLYRRLLRTCAERPLFRVWNYVPRINEATNGLENYRAFCVGRSLAFEAELGGEFAEQLPAASAVGCGGDFLEVVFAACEQTPVHFENPAQVPAYQYPEEHGPRSPSFARATVGRAGKNRWTFISGTAAIRGHETIAPGALDAQLDCTLENLRLIAQTAGLGERIGAGRDARRHFKIYLRHAADLGAARERLERSLFRESDDVIYLQADICRAALNVEIEATVVEPSG